MMPLDQELFTFVFFFLCKIVGLVLAASIGYVVVLGIYRLTFDPLSTYPGPKLWATSHIPMTISVLRGTLPYTVAKLHEEYGPVIRISPNELSYIREDAWPDIYGMSTTRPQLEKDPNRRAYDKLTTKKFIDGIIMTRRDDDHGRIRRNFSHSFSDKALREQEQLISKYFDLFIQKLHEQSIAPVDMTHWYNLLSFDIIGDLTFGEPFDCLEKSALNGWVKSLFSRIKMVALSSATSKVSKYLPSLLPQQMKAKAGVHTQYTDLKLQRRLNMKDTRPDFMTHVQHRMDTETGMSYPELKSTASTLILAGSETTATLLTGLTYQLLRNPSTMSRLIEEIRTTFSSESEITMTSVNSLKYENACIQEGFRVFPPVPNSLSRVTPPNGLSICGKFVPGNTLVGIPQWATNHSPTNFYQPSSFIPERWLDHDYSESSPFSHDARKAVQPFSVGPRNCLGRNLAMAELRVILARVLWNFDLELCEESNGWLNEEEMKPKVFVLWEKESLMVRLRPREKV